MSAHFLSSLVAVACVSAGCNTIDVTKLQAEAAPYLSKYGPQVMALQQKNETLLGKLKTLPMGDKVGAIIAGVTAHQARVTAIKGTLDGYPAMLGELAKGGKKEEVAQAMSQLEGLGGQLTSLTTESDILATQVTAAEAAAESAMAEGYRKKLADGTELTGSADGVEGQLVGFIEDAARPVDKATWFNFDRLSFKTGSAELDLEASRAQLANVAAIMKAYPKVELRIGGYTDNQGKLETNKKISTERAQAVVAELIKLGVDGKRLGAEGYGPEHPVCPANDTEECRAKNRRIAVRVTKK